MHGVLLCFLNSINQIKYFEIQTNMIGATSPVWWSKIDKYLNESMIVLN